MLFQAGEEILGQNETNQSGHIGEGSQMNFAKIVVGQVEGQQIWLGGERIGFENLWNCKKTCEIKCCY